jgi:branched-chain amino acid transport system ATP-binding protein
MNSMEPVEDSADSNAALLDVRSLSAGYGSAAVVHSVDLRVPAGDAIGLVGPNGAGKTTLLKAIAGVIRARGGEVALRNERVDGLSVAKRVRRGLILVPEGREIIAQLTVAENLWLGGYAAPKARAAATEQVFEMFPRLRERSRQVAGTLSGGEQQMLAIARGLMAQPSVLLLDEPSMGLAPALIDSLIDQIKRIQAAIGLSILLSEQGATIAREVCSRTYVLTAGRASAPIASSTSEADLLQMYMSGIDDANVTGPRPDDVSAKHAP